MSNAIITTGRKSQIESITLAKKIAIKLKIPFVDRKNLPINELAELYNVTNVLVAKKNSLHLISSGNEIFFHPSLSHLRIKNLINGEGDRMVEAMSLTRGMKVLDCTLGLGSDAIVESFVTGDEGNITAIEINPYLTAIVDYGLQTFIDERNEVTEAMRRIHVVNADYLDFLKSAATNSFDVVYFDPMFRHALERSCSLKPLREIVDHSAVSLNAINEACRVAKFKVVLKENAKSLEFERLGFKNIYGGKYSPIKYGIIETL